MGLNKLNHNFDEPVAFSSEAVGSLVAGSITAANGVIGNLATTLANPVFSGQALENFYVNESGFAGYDFYAVSNGAIQYLANTATANGSLRVTASPTQSLNAFMAVGQVMTITLMVPNAGTAYYPTSYLIDGVAYVPKWTSTPTGGNANALDVYTLSIFKVGVNAYNVIGSQTKYA
jgi:hypothetical protein